MLDYRHETFLAVYRIGSYTKAAQELNLTQPAVSQHIKALEAHYGCRLFTYANKTLTPTPEGRLLYRFASRISSDSDLLAEQLRQEQSSRLQLRFGATLSIGQYIMPEVLGRLLRAYPTASLSMLVENTERLLDKLEQGSIQFALIEGLFDKSAYHSELFALEPFIGVCSPDSPLAQGSVELEELLATRLIVRERGSGTREILEHLLHGRNLSIASFPQVTEIGNMEAIKQLVKTGLGITCLYQAAVQKELAAGERKKLVVPGLAARSELNFVFLKDSLHTQDFLIWFRLFRESHQEALEKTDGSLE